MQGKKEAAYLLGRGQGHEFLVRLDVFHCDAVAWLDWHCCYCASVRMHSPWGMMGKGGRKRRNVCALQGAGSEEPVRFFLSASTKTHKQLETLIVTWGAGTLVQQVFVSINAFFITTKVSAHHQLTRHHQTLKTMYASTGTDPRIQRERRDPNTPSPPRNPVARQDCETNP